MRKVLFLRTSSKPIPRVKRVALVAEELGYETLFIGAFREPRLGKTDLWDGIQVERAGSFYPMLNGSRLLTYLKGVIGYNIGAYRIMKREKPKIVHFSDVESFPSILCYRIFNKVKTLYNIHDNFSQRYPLPTLANALLNVFEGLIVKFADHTMVPEKFRASSLPGFCQQKISVVKNTPVDPGMSPHQGISAEKIKIVFAGWLDSGRGIATLLKLADKDDRYEIHVAGEGDLTIVSEIQKHKNCFFHGFIGHHDILELTKNCDFVFAHYSPHRVINIFAAPNKLAESLAVGRPVIINSEAKVSEPVLQHDCGIVTAYGDVDALHMKIREIVETPVIYLDMCIRARELFEKNYSWISVKEKTVEVFKKL